MNKLLMLLAVISASLISGQVYSQGQTLTKLKWHWNSPLKQDTVAGYTQVLRVGKTVYISGTVGLDLTPDGIAWVYRNLENSLKVHGLTFQHVVKENLYTTDIEAMKGLNEVRKKFYKGDYPAATWVQISRLYMAEAKVEVELIAQVP